MVHVDQAWLLQKKRFTMPSTFSCSSTELSTQNVPACPTCAIGKSNSMEGWEKKRKVVG